MLTTLRTTLLWILFVWVRLFGPLELEDWTRRRLGLPEASR